VKEIVVVSNYTGTTAGIDYWGKLSVTYPTWVTVEKSAKGKLSVSVKKNRIVVKIIHED
jgi:hypothetical protein